MAAKYDEVLHEATDRIEYATKVRDDLLSLIAMHRHGYVVIHDGQDDWLCEEDEFDRAMAAIMADIIETGYPTGKEPEDSDWYQDLCDIADCIYSRIGTPSDPAEVYGLPLDAEDLSDIVEALGLDTDLIPADDD